MIKIIIFTFKAAVSLLSSLYTVAMASGLTPLAAKDSKIVKVFFCSPQLRSLEISNKTIKVN